MDDCSREYPDCGAGSILICEFCKIHRKAEQQRDELLEFVQLVKQYFDDYDVSIWSEGGREQHPMSKKAENIINKIEEGDE